MLDNEVLDSQDPFNLACARFSIGIRKMGIIGLIRENIALQTRGLKRKVPCELLSLIAGRREPCIRRFDGICDRLVVVDQETPDAAPLINRSRFYIGVEERFLEGLRRTSPQVLMRDGLQEERPG
jgi:hypothetical protein